MSRFNVAILTLVVIAWIFLALVTGVVLSHFGVFPAPQIKSALRYLQSLTQPHHLFEIRYDGEGATIHDPQRMEPGVTLLTSYWPEYDWRPGVRIIDAEGRQLHHWSIDPAKIWPESPYDDRVANKKILMAIMCMVLICSKTAICSSILSTWG